MALYHSPDEGGWYWLIEASSNDKDYGSRFFPTKAAALAAYRAGEPMDWQE